MVIVYAGCQFIEVQDDQLSNHGKFWINGFSGGAWDYPSALTGAPLLPNLPAIQRFGGRFAKSSVFLGDLQTQEGMIFDPTAHADLVRRRFLLHPLHVCILYFPLLLHLAQNHGEIWQLPSLITLPLDDVLKQPGVLMDSTGQQVKCRAEWSARRPVKEPRERR